MKLILTLFVVLLLQNNLFAEESEGKISTIEKGQKAPYDGILLDNIAASKILSSDMIEEEKCDIDCQYKLDIQKTKDESVIETLNLSLDYERKEQLKMVEYYENELKIFQDFKLEPPPDDDDLMWTLIGASIGVITTSLAFGIIMGAIQ